MPLITSSYPLITADAPSAAGWVGPFLLGSFGLLAVMVITQLIIGRIIRPKYAGRLDEWRKWYSLKSPRLWLIASASAAFLGLVLGAVGSLGDMAFGTRVASWIGQIYPLIYFLLILSPIAGAILAAFVGGFKRTPHPADDEIPRSS